MQIRPVENKIEWEEFLLNQHPNTFLQSWNWGVFNEAIGKKIFRLGIYDETAIKGICLIIENSTRLGKFFYVPRGPILNWHDPGVFNLLVGEIRKLAENEKVDFLKIEPLLAESHENQEFFSKFSFRRAVSFTQVEDGWMLDITRSEEELLSDMRKTTRYLVKNGPKEGITVEISDSMEDIRDFVEMLFATADRKNFVNHSREYYIKQFEIMSADNQMRIFKSIRGGEVQAMSVVAFYGNSAYYLHGASKPVEGSVGYMLQWEAILEAKRRGLKYYDFWGVAKDRYFHPGHPWYGFSLFKRGFGGFKHIYIRGQDLPITGKYWLYHFAEQARLTYKKFREGYSVE
jgi:peptidoglycan pentaglycine glycine transferase (the first glycine)